MLSLAVERLPCPEEELRAAVARYTAALEAHRTTVGQPAPWPEYEVVREVLLAGGEFQVVYPPEGRPACPGPEECYDWDGEQWVLNPAKQAQYARLVAIRDDAQCAALVAQLTSLTNEQIGQYVDTNITDLASARTLFKRMLKVLALLARQL